MIPKKICAAIVALFATHLAVAQFAADSLDVTFGNNGIVTTDINANYMVGGDMLCQPDGKFIMTGAKYNNSTPYVTVTARYKSNGALDSTFGLNGFATVNITGQDVGVSLALQPDHKIIVAGYSDNSASNTTWFLCRLQSNGTLDPSFGTNGVVTSAVGIGMYSTGVVLQPDGKIVIVGGDGYSSLLRRYNSNGTLDNTFGVGGVVANPNFSAYDVNFCAGKILAAGEGTSVLTPAIFRFLIDGRVDSSFGTNGMVSFTYANNPLGRWNKLTIDTNHNKIFAVGKCVDNHKVNATSMAVARYNYDGTMDNNFFNSIIPTGPGPDFGAAACILPDGKTMIAGYSNRTSGGHEVTLTRLDTNGMLDNTFGFWGTVKNNVSGDNLIKAIALQSDGKVVVGGENVSNFLMVRYGLNRSSGVSSVASVLTGVFVYPNPINNQLSVDLSKVQTLSDCRFELTDAIGKVMAKGTLKTGVNSVNTSALSSGTYLLRVTNGAERMMTKVVK